MREEFEKLPNICSLINDLIFDDDSNEYVAKIQNPFEHDSNECFVNGAWYAYQEQQKKIEGLVNIINTGLKIEQNMSNQIHSLKEKIDTAIEYLDSIEGLVWYEQIKDIPK